MLCHAQRTSDTSVPSPDPAQGTCGDATACCDAVSPTEGSLMHAAAPGDPKGAGRAVSESHADIKERRLLADISNGSRLALRRLHSLYFSRLATFFTLVMPTSTAELIDDLVADTMFDVWHMSASLGRQASVRVAIMRIAWKHGSKQLAQSGAHSSPPEQFFSGPQSWTSSSTAPEALRPLSGVLATLHANERAIVQLVHFGHSREEVADILSMPCHAIDTYLASAMIALHPWLAAKYSSTSGN